MLPPETKYARAGDVSIAYQAFGSGRMDLVLLSTFWNQIEHHWELPSFARALERLASFARVVMLDKRGSGLSDRVGGTPSAEERMDDIRAVMEAVGSARAALLGASEGGTLSALFAATYPEQVEALIIYGSTARWTDTLSESTLEFMNEYFESGWGSGDFAAVIAPTLSEDEDFHRWFARLERLTATPGAARDLMRWNAEIDVRAALPAITAPTLVLHRSGDMAAPIEGAATWLSTSEALASSSSPAMSTTRSSATSTASWTRSRSSSPGSDRVVRSTERSRRCSLRT